MVSPSTRAELLHRQFYNPKFCTPPPRPPVHYRNGPPDLKLRLVARDLRGHKQDSQPMLNLSNLPSKPPLPSVDLPKPQYPFQLISSDYFSY